MFRSHDMAYEAAANESSTFAWFLRCDFKPQILIASCPASGANKYVFLRMCAGLALLCTKLAYRRRWFSCPILQFSNTADDAVLVFLRFHRDSILEFIGNSELVDKRFWLILLLLHITNPKIKSAVIELLAIVALAIAGGVNHPNSDRMERVALIKVSKM